MLCPMFEYQHLSPHIHAYLSFFQLEVRSKAENDPEHEMIKLH